MIDDPLASTSWSDPKTIAGFARTPPNARLLEVARSKLAVTPRGRALDVGCGVGRNALPLAAQGWRVAGLDLSLAALRAAAGFPRALAVMEHLPIRDTAIDFVVAHGIWNLARTADQFRAAVREAARVARSGATLFIFVFSRSTLPPDAAPVAGEPFVFTQFSGEPQCFLTAAQLIQELGAAGFAEDATLPLHELNRRDPGALTLARAPVIYEGLFRRE